MYFKPHINASKARVSVLCLIICTMILCVIGQTYECSLITYLSTYLANIIDNIVFVITNPQYLLGICLGIVGLISVQRSMSHTRYKGTKIHIITTSIVMIIIPCPCWLFLVNPISVSPKPASIESTESTKTSLC